MNFSYWDNKSWLNNIDFIIIGSGIVGLSCAIELKNNHPKAKVLVLEKGLMPYGASTRNAGFACFGSMTEILNDLNNHSEKEVFNLISQRVSGLKKLRNLIGDKKIDYKELGGNEIFLHADRDVFESSAMEIEKINSLIAPLFDNKVFSIKDNNFGFNNTHKKIIYNNYEGQIDTAKMMSNLLFKARQMGVKILNNINVKDFQDDNSKIHIRTNFFEINCNKLFIATNGFSNSLLNEDISPARAQVLITKPIENLRIKGTFHLDQGYYYFRNIDKRILLGGGRNLDFNAENTTKFKISDKIQNKLEDLLFNVILPSYNSVEIEHRWTGIMGVSKKKTTITKQVSENVYCGIRLGGMGIAVGTQVGSNLAKLI